VEDEPVPEEASDHAASGNKGNYRLLVLTYFIVIGLLILSAVLFKKKKNSNTHGLMS